MRAILFLIIVLFVPLVQANDIKKIDVFTTTFIPVKSSDDYVSTEYLLDEMDMAVKELGRNLPGTLDEAIAEANLRMNTQQGSRLVSRIKSSADGMVLAWSRKIDYLPAILINDRYAIYGIYDVDDAVTIFKENK